MTIDTPREVPVAAILKATYGSAEAQIREGLRLLGYEPQRKRLLLKPNVVTYARWLPVGGVPRAVHTDLRFLEALLRVFAGYEIVIAEGGVAHGDTATGAIVSRAPVVGL
ncbi:MAG: hypothetical protein JXA74_11685 [Anaerolineae bacterium]|nr:hypothetical protein [Anaerolineae bacterium]